MTLVDRVAIIVRAKEPFLAWARAVDQDSTIDGLSPEELTTVFLVGGSSAYRPEKVLRRHFIAIFEEQLRSWRRFPKDWPSDRSFGTFRRWFDASVIDLIFDLGNTPRSRSRTLRRPKPS
jgi:hypothetical protein